MSSRPPRRSKTIKWGLYQIESRVIFNFFYGSFLGVIFLVRPPSWKDCKPHFVRDYSGMIKQYSELSSKPSNLRVPGGAVWRGGVPHYSHHLD